MEFGSSFGSAPPVLAEEVVRKMQAGVQVYDGDSKIDRMKGGIATVTNFRVHWQDAGRTSGVSWHLSQVIRAKAESGGFFGTPKVVVHLQPLAPAPSPSGAPAAPPPRPRGATWIKFGFKDGGKDKFFEELQVALQKKSWTAVPPPQKRAKPAAFNTRNAGIAGLLKEKERDRRHESAVTNTAFSDLSSLVSNAREIVDLANRYASQNAKQPSSTEGGAAPGAGAGAGGGGGTAPPTQAESEQFGSLVRSIGIVSPVTRAAAGDLFPQELARQLATFLRPRLEKAGGMITLTDAYCLYNRARGTDLVSPEDLVDACRLLQGLKLGMHMTTLGSRVQVLMLDSHSDDAVVTRLTDMIKEHEFISAPQLSRLMRLPLPICQRHLEVAEARGVLCRDDTIRGLRFYPNKFATLGA